MDSNTIKFAQLTGAMVYIHDQLAGMLNVYGWANKLNPNFSKVYKYLPIAEKRKWYLCGQDGILAKTKEPTEQMFDLLDAEAKKPNTDLCIIYKLTYLHNLYERAWKWVKDNPSFYEWAVMLPKTKSWGNTAANTMLEYAFLGGKAYGLPYVK